MHKIFLRHPKNVCMTYTEHLRLSARLSGLFLIASVKAFVHALFFQSSSTDAVLSISQIIRTAGCRRND